MSKPIDKEPVDKGKIIQEQLKNIHMDPWYFIYKVYVNPASKSEKPPRLISTGFGKVRFPLQTSFNNVIFYKKNFSNN